MVVNLRASSIVARLTRSSLSRLRLDIAMYRIGVVGLGRQTLTHHLPGLRTCRNGKLVAVCDSNPQRTFPLAEQLGVPGFLDAKEMLHQSRLDFIILAVPHDQYLPLLNLAAHARVNVLKDKPYARTVHEAREFADLFTRIDRCVATHVQRRLTPHYVIAKALLPEIGEVFWAEIKYTLFVTNPDAGWRGSRSRAGGGCIIDMGYHMIDLILWYFGLPRVVHALTSCRALAGANYDAEDSAQILYSYGNQGVGTCLISRRSPPKSESVRIMGTNGILELTQADLVHRSPRGDLIARYPAAATENHIDAASATFECPDNYSTINRAHLEHLAVVEACYASARGNRGVDPREFL